MFQWDVFCPLHILYYNIMLNKTNKYSNMQCRIEIFFKTILLVCIKCMMVKTQFLKKSQSFFWHKFAGICLYGNNFLHFVGTKFSQLHRGNYTMVITRWKFLWRSLITHLYNHHIFQSTLVCIHDVFYSFIHNYFHFSEIWILWY